EGHLQCHRARREPDVRHEGEAGRSHSGGHEPGRRRGDRAAQSRRVKGESEDVRRLRLLWDDHTRRPFPAVGTDPRIQEVALYASWIGSMVEVALRHGALDPNRAVMLKTRRAEGNEGL